jgi:hypothetical protein
VAQAHHLDHERLDGGHQRLVDPGLADEVVAAVLEEPPRQRQQQPPLHGDDRASEEGTVALEAQPALHLPVFVLEQHVRQQQVFARRERLAQDGLDVVEDRRLDERGIGPDAGQFLAKAGADPTADLRHRVVNERLGSCVRHRRQVYTGVRHAGAWMDYQRAIQPPSTTRTCPLT